MRQRWQEFAWRLARFVRQNRQTTKGDTLLLLTADHGQIAPRSAPITTCAIIRLVRHLVMLPRRGRLPSYSPNRPCGAIRDFWPGSGETNSNLYPPKKCLPPACWDCAPYAARSSAWSIVVFPKNNVYWWWVNKENRLHGRHGGLSMQEMLVPFFALEI